MNFVFLKGSGDQAVELVNRLGEGRLKTEAPVRLLGYYANDLALIRAIRDTARNRERNVWPFITQNDNDEILIRMSW
jgi:hypothetical protein